MLLLLLQGSLFSCSDWLNVDAESQVTQDDFFSTYEGYRTALNGIYRKLGAPDLYTRELTWGMASALGQNYTANTLSYKYRLLDAGEYEHAQVEPIIYSLWAQGYNVIANCNNLIQETEKRDTSFFLEGKVEKDLILGEARGLRAMMHLDLLRLFAPSPKADDGRPHIPYVTEYPCPQPKHMSVTAVLDSVIKDLEYCKQTLVYIDTLYNTYAMSSVTSRMHGNNTLVKGGLFFHFRGTRMNYFAACGLLARAYLYRGDKVNALKHAEDMYQFASRRRWYTFTSSGNLGASDVNRVYRKMYEDILLACVNQFLYDDYESQYESNYYFFFYKNVNHLFGDDLDDFRKTKLIEDNGSSRRWSRPGGDHSDYTISQIVKYQGPLAPVIRLTEVIYVMCECLADTDLSRAIELLQTLRTNRGAKTPLNRGLSKEEFLKVLYNDMTREFMSEGQTFFLYKRLNAPMYNGDNPLDMSKRYVLPLPYGETGYIAENN